MNEVYIAVQVSDGMVYHHAFQTRGRFPGRPKGGWVLSETGEWTREATEANIEFELARGELLWGKRALIIGWRILSDAEHAMFEKDRAYRNALVDGPNGLAHDMPKARELHRARIRKSRTLALPALDVEWSRAVAKGDQKSAALVETQRQQWRDATADPRIEQAKTIEELKALPLGF